jgi:hypothetical protein
MSSLFCRHNRPTANCPICSREFEDQLRSSAPEKARSSRARKSSRSKREQTGSVTKSTRTRHTASRLITKKLERPQDDGYRCNLVPGIRATADAKRLAQALARAISRLQFPGPYHAVADQPNSEAATYLAFLLALVGREAHDLHEIIVADFQSEGNFDVFSQTDNFGALALPVTASIPEHLQKTITAYNAWIQRFGSQKSAFIGEEEWSPTRRFARVFERLAFPNFGRSERFELLVTLNSTEIYELEPDSLFVPADDDVSIAAKRLLHSGEKLFLERRVRELADGCDVPIAALDYAFWLWDTSEQFDLFSEEFALLPSICQGLKLEVDDLVPANAGEN